MGSPELKVGRLEDWNIGKLEDWKGETWKNLPTCQPANLHSPNLPTCQLPNPPLAIPTSFKLLLSSVLLALTSLTGAANSVVAQQTLSSCRPPEPDEYILLVLSPTRESQKQLQQALPTGIQSTVCQYLNDPVTRIASFREIEDANAWARYVNEIVGLSAFVVQAAPATPPTSSPSYNPQPLGQGYAVLVDYFNQPEVASQLQQILGSDVGLVSYGQRPYLLATYTTSENAANSLLRELSDRGFWSMVVDSRRVTLLKPVVSF